MLLCLVVRTATGTWPKYNNVPNLKMYNAKTASSMLYSWYFCVFGYFNSTSFTPPYIVLCFISGGSTQNAQIELESNNVFIQVCNSYINVAISI